MTPAKCTVYYFSHCFKLQIILVKILLSSTNLEGRSFWWNLTNSCSIFLQTLHSLIPHCLGRWSENKQYIEMPAIRDERREEEELAVLPAHTKVLVTGNNRTNPVHVGLQAVVKKAVGLGGWYWLVLTNGDEVRLQRNALSVIEAPIEHNEDEYRREVKEVCCRKRPPLIVDLRKLDMVSLRKYCQHFKLLHQSSREQLIEAVERHFSSQQLDEFQVIAGFLQASKRRNRTKKGED